MEILETAPILLKNFDAEQLCEQLEPLGVTLRQARQIHAAAVRRQQWPTPQADGLPAAMIERVRRCTVIPRLTLLDRKVSPQDNFAKYLFRGAEEDAFETVRIPLLHRPEDPKYVVCVSSQVGCSLGCRFCATGRMGFRRNLAPWEILDQVIQVQADSEHPVRGVVFMGMGEPMLNFDAVAQAARLMTASYGLAIAGKAITISTAGVTPGIRRFIALQKPYRLVVSLNTADPELRRRWMPVEKQYPTAELFDALREYHAATGRRVILAWTMISGLNTCPEDARQLASLARGLPIKLDLIDINDPTGRWKPPSTEELATFRDALSAELGQPVARRYSGGRDIHAACGMLSRCREPQSPQRPEPCPKTPSTP
ncbi:MAG: radical SAM protein [Planctomycetaceae bacterium]|nr:radical SAM protein [Planctomycetaceae bacterium]